MTRTTTLSKVHEIRGHQDSHPDRVDTEVSTDAVHDFREVQPKLADDFETWYAQKKLTTKRDEDSWGGAFPRYDPDDPAHSWMHALPEMNEPHSPEPFDFNSPDQVRLQDPSNGLENPPASWMDWSQYRNGDVLAQRKVKIRKWKLSTPPALCNVGEKHMQKLQSRRPARKTIRHSWNISWGDGNSSWLETFSKDDTSSSADDPDIPLATSGFETTLSERTWEESQMLEQHPELKKYHPYKPSLLRWCYSSTED
jgi:hypothetical protein